MKKYDWESTTYFNGVELPGVAIAIDHINESNTPGLSKQTSTWLWNFTICSGIRKTENSDSILIYANEALNALRIHRQHLLTILPEKWDGDFSETVLDHWEIALEEIIKEATRADFCEWYS